jgi:hypothetical protein
MRCPGAFAGLCFEDRCEIGRAKVGSAMAARGEGFSACDHTLLPEVAKLQNPSMLQEIAVKSLDDLDPQIVGSAAAYLMEFGSPSAEDVLRAHFTAWSERWKGRESELRYVPGRSLDGQYQANAGSNLMEALASGRGWLADETKLHRLIDLSVGQQQRQQAEQYLSAWQKRPRSIQFVSVNGGQFQIAQYQERSLQAAQEKLLQFPPGRAFEWSGSGGQDGDAKVFQEISGFASEQGLKVIAIHP